MWRETDGVLDETEEENEGLRPIFPSVVPLTVGFTARMLGVDATFDAGSPARSANVFRFAAGSGTAIAQLRSFIVGLHVRVEPLCLRPIELGGGIMLVDRALLAEADISKRLLFDVDGILLGGRRCDVYCSNSRMLVNL